MLLVDAKPSAVIGAPAAGMERYTKSDAELCCRCYVSELEMLNNCCLLAVADILPADLFLC